MDAGSEREIRLQSALSNGGRLVLERDELDWFRGAAAAAGYEVTEVVSQITDKLHVIIVAKLREVAILAADEDGKGFLVSDQDVERLPPWLQSLMSLGAGVPEEPSAG